MKEIFIHQRFNGKVKIALCFPSTYAAGMSSLAYQRLYKIFSKEYFSISRFFLEKNGIYSPDKKYNLKDCDIVLFTISFEPDAINTLKMLNMSRIFELNIDNRPLLILGGIFATINPDFFSHIFDFQYKGEIDENENVFIDLLSHYNVNLKNEVIENLKHKLKDKIYKTDYLKDISYTSILSDKTSFKNTFLLEISRGCKYKCPFCLVSQIYGNFRPADFNEIIDKINIGLKHTGKIGLVSALTDSHPDIKKIAEFILNKGGYPSFSSLRLENIDNDILQILSTSGQRQLTIAPESASEATRKKLMKNYNNGKIISIIENAINYGIRNFKVYLMAGLPDEFDFSKDTIALSKEIRNLFLIYAKKHGIMPNLILDISLFTPKPYTKWESQKIISKKEYTNRIKELRKELSPIGIKIRNDDPYYAHLQYLLSRANKNLADSILNCIKENKNVKSFIKKQFKNF